MNTRNSNLIGALALLLALHSPTALAQGTTAFSYQGRLTDGSSPANGNYDLRFTLYDAASGGTQVGGALTNAATPVTNGLFMVTVDFGAGVFDGNGHWLELGVRTNGSSVFTPLNPRQPVTPTPYAVYATTADSAQTVANGVYTAGSYADPAWLASLAGTKITGNIGGKAAGFTGSLSGDVTGTQDATVVASVGGQTAANVASGVTTANGASSADTAGTLVKRDASGNFAAGTITANLAGNATTATTASNLVGTVADGQLSGNVALRNGTNAFSRTNAFAGVTLATNVNNVFNGSFNGNGAGLTSLNAANVIGAFPASQLSGTLLLAQLPSVVLTNNETGVKLNGSFSGNGAGVTNVGLGTLNAPGAILWGNFITASSPGIGSYPFSVVAADVNADGKLDLISANIGDDTLTVLTNNGSGGFGLASSPGVGIEPISVVAADVNGDGKLDLISANYGNNTLTVLTNTPTFQGSFAGDGAALTSLNAANLTGTLADGRLSGNVALVNASQTFSGQNTFSGPTSLGSTLRLNDNTIYFRQGSDQNHGLGWFAPGSWVGANPDGPVLFGYTGGGLGSTSSGQNLVLAWNNTGGGDVFTDLAGANPGTLLPGLTFGATGSGEGISSKRTAGTGQYGLDFYSNRLLRMRIGNDGNVGIGATSPGRKLVIQGDDGDAYEDARQVLIQGDADTNQQLELGYKTSGNYGSIQAIQQFTGTKPLVLQPLGGNVGIGTTSPGHLLQVNNAYSDGNTWSPSSDRNVKAGFEPVDARTVLAQVVALPVLRWHYTNDVATPHVGPVAQDFYAAFGVGADDRHIADVDEGGVTLAAIQGLNQKLEEQQVENAELKRRLTELEQLVHELRSNSK